MFLMSFLLAGALHCGHLSFPPLDFNHLSIQLQIKKNCNHLIDRLANRQHTMYQTRAKNFRYHWLPTGISCKERMLTNTTYVDTLYICRYSICVPKRASFLPVLTSSLLGPSWPASLAYNPFVADVTDSLLTGLPVSYFDLKGVFKVKTNSHNSHKLDKFGNFFWVGCINYQ